MQLKKLALKDITLLATGLMALVFALTACTGSDPVNKADDKSVYVAGCSYDLNSFTPILWTNGVPETLTSGLPGGSVAYSVFVSGTDVYVAGMAGYTDDDSFGGAAILWTNGVPEILPGGIRASSVFVSGTDVYVAGINFSDDEMTAILWTNGIPQTLEGLHGVASSVYVSGTDVYVAGYFVDVWGMVATLWKNGVPQTLQGGSATQGGCAADSVFVSGNDVYVTGRYYPLLLDFSMRPSPKLWKNGVSQTLTGGPEYSVPASVYVSGTNVYMAGLGDPDYQTAAILWTDGVAQTLQGGVSAHSVFVTDKDVYVVGESEGGGRRFATLWKNREPQSLANGWSQDSIALSVFAK
jgi:hypothetical protein